ncbi:unnamed protein product [Staurois parvus]|uniref:Uncharacterized protein n=1 Tax=Staurois parvus TaxID=386267 RepID=A0ABN9HG94_9NEOB|nr:unnamed protein product [Staurois parvus]
MLRHFSLGRSMCSLADCNLFSTRLFPNSGTLRGLLADSLASHTASSNCNSPPQGTSHLLSSSWS